MEAAWSRLGKQPEARASPFGSFAHKVARRPNSLYQGGELGSLAACLENVRKSLIRSTKYLTFFIIGVAGQCLLCAKPPKGEGLGIHDEIFGIPSWPDFRGSLFVCRFLVHDRFLLLCALIQNLEKTDCENGSVKSNSLDVYRSE